MLIKLELSVCGGKLRCASFPPLGQANIRVMKIVYSLFQESTYVFSGKSQGALLMTIPARNNTGGVQYPHLPASLLSTCCGVDSKSDLTVKVRVAHPN